MATTIAQPEKNRFPLVYEIIVWVAYTALYKYAYYVGMAKLPNPGHADFPHLQLLPYALALTLYIIPFYRWLVPALLIRKKYAVLSLLTIAWFFFIPKLTNLAVSYLFMQANDPGAYHVFFENQFTIHQGQAASWKGWDLNILVTDFIAFSSVALTRYAFINERKKHLLERENFQLQLEALKAQLNPHFLFNTLNSIYGMSLSGNKDTPGYVLRLADMMRYILYDCREPAVELEKDIAFTENYIAMEKKRYPGSDIRFSISVTDETIRIAPLLLIPLVENSFKHGAHRLHDKGFIHADLRADEKMLTFVVENDKFMHTTERKTAGGVGIENLRKRLQAYYSGRHELRLEDTHQRFKVTLTIQLNTTA